MIRLQGKSRIINYDEIVCVSRDGPVSFSDEGKAIKPLAPLIFNAKANLQPLGGKDLLIVPEGDRTKEQFWMWSESKIQINDLVIRNGIKYQIQTVQDWGSYTQSRLMRVDVGPNAS